MTPVEISRLTMPPVIVYEIHWGLAAIGPVIGFGIIAGFFIPRNGQDK